MPSGASFWVRGLTDEPVELEQVKVWVGSKNAEPGADGVSIFPTLYPGRVLGRIDVGEETISWGPSQVGTSNFGSTQLYGVPMEPWSAEVVNGSATLVVDGNLTITFDAGAILLDGQVANQTVNFLGGVLGNEHSRAMPGDFQSIRHDDVISPVEVYAALRLLPVADSGSWTIETPGTLSWSQPSGAEVLSGVDLQLLRFDPKQGYWKEGGILTVEGDTLTGSVVTQFGWLAIGGQPQVPRGCVIGQFETAEGTAVAGAEVLYTEAARFGVRRTWSTEEGEWCVEPILGVELDASAFYLDGQDLTRRFSLDFTLPIASVGSCAIGGCSTAGTLTLGVLGQ